MMTAADGPQTVPAGSGAGPWLDRSGSVPGPAPSANPGPGFGAVGLSRGVHDVVHATVIGGGLEIEVTGIGEPTATHGERHLVVRAMRAAFEVLGGQPPGIGLRCVNAIPHGFGLGSSAAAIVAGGVAAPARCRGGGAGRGGRARRAGHGPVLAGRAPTPA